MRQARRHQVPSRRRSGGSDSRCCFPMRRRSAGSRSHHGSLARDRARLSRAQLARGDGGSSPTARAGYSRQRCRRRTWRSSATPSRGGHGRVGLATASSLDRTSDRATGGAALLRGEGPDRWPAVVGSISAEPVPVPRGQGRGAPALRAAPASPPPRGGDGARGCLAERNPAPLGHANLGITSVYLEGIDAGEIIETVHGRRAPLIPAATALGH
jgi:hypothetical protein